MNEQTPEILDALEPMDIGAYLYVADPVLKLISVFDDLRYDRSDADVMSAAMRRHAIGRLQRYGFRQTRGSVLHNPDSDVRCLIPTVRALGASPFDCTRYTARREQDYYLLTPTQTACQFIDHYEIYEATARIERLIHRQPINIYRVLDFLERTPAHDEFRRAIAYLDRIQADAVATEPLRSRRALGTILS